MERKRSPSPSGGATAAEPQPQRWSGNGALVALILLSISRWALARRHLHPDIARFCDEAVHAVDKFHFVKNHIGLWCDQFVNPYNLRALEEVNTEVCEQRFQHINKFGSMLRRMRRDRRERFRWTLLTIVDMDHKFRGQELF